MHIVLIAPDDLPVPALRGGSVQIYLESLLRAWKHSPNLQITLFSPGRVPVGLPNITHHVIPEHGLRYQHYVLKKLRTLHPDLIQVENRPKFLLRIKKSLPHTRTVLNLHSLTFLGPRHIPRKWVRPALRSATYVSCNSHYLKREIARRFHLNHSDWHPVVIHPGVTLSEPQVATGKIELSQNPLRLLFVGRVIHQKGLHVLIEAIRILTARGVPVHLTVIGRTPPWEANYGKLVRRAARNLPIRFQGFVSHKNLGPFYEAADLFVCPSQALEAFGLVNLEAMSHGLPVIASKVGGIREVVTRRVGILIENPRNAFEFAQAIKDLASDPSRCMNLAVNAQKRASRFSWENTAHAFQTLYES